MTNYDVLKSKIRAFQNRSYTDNFTYDQLLDKYNGKPRCYLTNKDIDLSNSQSYHLDHKKPVAAGGLSILDNCEFILAEVNIAKHAFTYDEFIDICHKVYLNKLNNDDESKYPMTVDAIAEMLDAKPSTVRKWIKNNRLDPFNVKQIGLLAGALTLFRLTNPLIKNDNVDIWLYLRSLRNISKNLYTN